jgi:hypothetical protein
VLRFIHGVRGSHRRVSVHHRSTGKPPSPGNPKAAWRSASRRTPRRLS